MSSLTSARGKGRQLRARGPAVAPAVSRARADGSSFIGVATKGGSYIAKDILDQFARKSTSEQLPPDSFKGINGLVEPLYDAESLARHMDANTYHARAVKTKAQDTAGQGWELVPLVEDPSEEQEDRIEEFFENLEDDIQDVLVAAMTDRESIGWFSIEMVRENKDPEGPVVILKNIPAHTMRAHEDGKRFVQIRGHKRRWFKRAGLTDVDVHKLTGEIEKAGQLDPEDRANEVIWNNIYTTRSDVYGVPDHIPAVGAILGDIARRDYNITFFQNFGVPAYAVFISGDYDPGDAVNEEGFTEDEDPDNGPYKTPLHSEIEAHLQKVADNPHSVLLLTIPSADGGEVEVKFEKLAVEMREASFRLYREDNKAEVLSAHAVPPYRAGIAEQGSLGGTVAEEMDEIYRDSVLAPRQRILERIINRFVLASMEITDWTFRLESINISDESRELEFALQLFEHGALTPNDLIRNFGLRYGIEPADGNAAMDAHYIAGTPIDQVSPSEAETVLVGLRDRLLKIAGEHVGDEDGSYGTELLEAFAGLEASIDAAAKIRGASSWQTQGRVLKGSSPSFERARRARARAQRSRGERSDPAASNGHRGGNNA